ncbi:MAG TPA: hypothetical protein VFQ85_02280 [Mycobacteriales bacterium]|jgi:hypothetical protein|nr:hypothetical protein [Mycobacteriales bacterium]
MATEPGRASQILNRFGGRYGVALTLLGLLTVGLAWNGAAGLPATPAQMPYLISGLGIGLTLSFVGGALMVVHAHREDRARLEAKLDEVIDAIGRGGLAGAAGAPAPQDLTGLVVAGSASYHVPGCRLVDGREEVQYLTPQEAQARYLAPCRVCQPHQSNVTTVQ